MQAIADFIIHANPFLVYLVVAMILLLESSGVPVANTTLLLFTGALAAMGYLNIWILTFAAIVGSISGACLAYTIGARGGRRAFLRLTGRLRIDEQKVRMTERWLQKAGVWMIFCSRMTPYVRPFACVLGGITHMPFGFFCVAALSGSLIWCVVTLRIGMAMGPHWRLALLLMQRYTLPSLCLLALLFAAYVGVTTLVKRNLRRRLRQGEGERGEPELLEV